MSEIVASEAKIKPFTLGMLKELTRYAQKEGILELTSALGESPGAIGANVVAILTTIAPKFLSLVTELTEEQVSELPIDIAADLLHRALEESGFFSRMKSLAGMLPRLTELAAAAGAIGK